MRFFDSTNTLKIDDTLRTMASDKVALLVGSETIPTGWEASNCIFLTKNKDSKILMNLVVAKGFRHIIQTSSTNLCREIKLSSILIERPNDFIKDPISFVLSEKAPEKKISVEFRKSAARKEVLARALEYLSHIPRSEILKNNVSVIADELYTNALYNAPTDETGRNYQTDCLRSVPVELKSEHPARLQLGYDKERLVIACEDPFGSLNERSFLAKLLSCYSSPENLSSVNFDKGGAGLGCRMLLDRSSEFFVICQKRKKTVFICCLPLEKSARKSAVISKNIYIAFF